MLINTITNEPYYKVFITILHIPQSYHNNFSC